MPSSVFNVICKLCAGLLLNAGVRVHDRGQVHLGLAEHGMSHVGGGYRFIHPTLQDGYADRWEALRPDEAQR